MSVLPQPRHDGKFIHRIPFVLSVRTVAFALLLALTLIAGSSWFKGISPVDARTNEFIGDRTATFEMSFLGSVLEPFAAIAHVTVGAPNYRIAAISTICWLFLGIALAIYWRRRSIRIAPGICVLKSCAAGLAGASFYVLYMFSAIMLPFPSWSLMPGEREVIAADLHSHTFASHDGLASLEENLDYHRARGYGVAAITDHFSLSSQSIVPLLAVDGGTSIESIRGSELSIANFGKRDIFLLVVGARPDLVLFHSLLGTRKAPRSMIKSAGSSSAFTLRMAPYWRPVTNCSPRTSTDWSKSASMDSKLPILAIPAYRRK
jgi:hypothetical protein